MKSHKQKYTLPINRKSDEVVDEGHRYYVQSECIFISRQQTHFDSITRPQNTFRKKSEQKY